MSGKFGDDELRRAIVAALGALRVHQAVIDEANVYPVPDGDTGTNMVLTMTAAAEALGREDPFAAVPAAALMGARGNSGVILAQILRGFLPIARNGDADALREALREGTRHAYDAVLDPVEGTILSVMRGASEGARGETPVDVLESAAAAAREALDRTPEQLPILKEAEVLDAGGMGLWVFFDAMAASLSGRDPVPPPKQQNAPRVARREAGSARFAYEVQYLLESKHVRLDELRGELGRIGDSVVVSGGGGLWNVHVHTNDVERAIEIGGAAGTVRAPAITAFADQMTGTRTVPLARALSPVTVVAVVSGEGFAALYRELGAGVIVDGGPTMNPSVGEIAEAIEQAPAADVIVLPNNDDAIPAAMQACEFVSDRRAVVVETRDLAHGITTMLAYGDARDFEHNAAQMRQAASVAATAAVVVAAREAPTPSGTVRAGQSLGMIDGEVVTILDDPVDAALSICRTLDEDSPVEVISVFAGASAPAGERDRLLALLADAFVGVDVEMRDGGQPVERYLIAVE